MEKVAEVLYAVRKKIVPSVRLRRAVEAKAEEIRSSVERECARAGLQAEVRLDGSVAKDTWLREHADVDIFMRVSPELTKIELRDRCLPIARRALKDQEIVERYAEHPYIESTVDLELGGKLRVNVVPCYMVEKGKWLSATDRSPYHTQYIRQRLAVEQRDQVRLLKAFMRGIGSYGADIKTGGFSGMLCETLIVSHGNVQKVMEDFAEWQTNRFIDVENYYGGRGGEAHRIFKEPLVVIDPVDKGRNLAAAVRNEQLWNFVAACRHFILKPALAFFFERPIRPLTRTDYQKQLASRGSTLLCLVVGKVDVVVDILWSQLYRTERALLNLLAGNDFKVMRSTAWSDETRLNVILFELEEGELPLSRLHDGPPVSKLKESGSFLSKHLRKASTMSGPWVENGRWFVQKRRSTTRARALLESALREGGADVGVASSFARSLKKNCRIFENESIGPLIASNAEFARMMRTYLSGRPTWLA